MIGSVGNTEREEECDVDDDNLLACDDFLGLLAIESVAKEQYRDDEHDGWQEFVCWVKANHFYRTFLVFVVYICKHETCPGCYLNEEVCVYCVQDTTCALLLLLDTLLSML